MEKQREWWKQEGGRDGEGKKGCVSHFVGYHNTLDIMYNTQCSPQGGIAGWHGLGGVCDHINGLCYHIKEKTGMESMVGALC